MWTNENRGRYDRSKLRYPSDLTDEEWALSEPLIPAGKRGGNRRTVNVREVVNGLMYVLSTGCQWRAIPKDLPPRSTVYDYFDLWSWDGTLDRIHEALLARVDLEIVKRLGHAKGFVVLPKRWIVERTLAWLGRCRKLAKDWECLNRKALAFLRLASIRLMLRKLCNPA